MQSLRSFGPASLIAAGVLALAVPASSAEKNVSIVNFKFVPPVIAIDAGDEITWTNNGSAPHDTISGKPEDPNPGDLWNSGIMSPGDTFSRIFQASDTSDYHCGVHPTQMFGKVYVNGTGVQSTMIPKETTITAGKINTTAFLLNFGGSQAINVQVKVKTPANQTKTVINKDITLGANKRVQKDLAITLPNGLPKGIYHVILEVRDSGGNVLSSDDDLYNKFVVGGEGASPADVKAESPDAAWDGDQS